MIPEQPMSSEGNYLLYLLGVSEDGTLSALRLKDTTGYWDLAWLERQERAAGYALGRIRESLVHRIKRLAPDDEGRAFLVRVLQQSQGEDGGKVIAPRYPAQALGTVVGMLRNRLQSTRRAA